MSGCSDYVESSAIASIAEVSNNCYIFNKFNRLEGHQLDKDTMKLKKTLHTVFGQGIVQMKFTSIKDLGDYVLVLLDNGDLEYCKYADELIVEKTMRFPTYDGLAYAPSFLDATNECLLVAGYRGLMLVGPIHPESMSPLGSPASRTIEFDGVLLLARLVQVLGTTYVFSVTQSDDAEESGVIMYKVIDSRRPEFLTSFKLPPTLSIPNVMIQLHGGYFLLIAETNGLLLKLDDTELVIKNQFVINAQPFSSQAEVPTLISAVSNLFTTDFGDAFLACTNKGEILCFEHSLGQFVISPVQLNESELPTKFIISSLHYSIDDDIVLAIGENMDGALLQYSKSAYSVKLIRPIPNWAPIVDIDSTKKKNGIVLASSGTPGICGMLHQVRKGVRNQIISQTDQCFRGATRIWSLKRYKTDKHHSFVAVSFTCSTALFRLKELELEMIGACELETSCPTVLLANLDTTSFWVQVCPDRVLVVKICEPDELKAPIASIWRPEQLQVSAAAVIGNVVILLDDSTGHIHFLSVSCKIATGRADITLVGSIETGHRQGTSLAAIYLSRKPEADFYLAAAIDGRCDFWKVTCDDVFSFEKMFDLHVKRQVNSIAFWRRETKTFFAIGHRSGEATFYMLDELAQTHLLNLLDSHIGDHPVKLTVVQDDCDDRHTVCCTSRGVWFIAHAEDLSGFVKLHAEKFHPHVECFVEVYLNSGAKQRTFLATRKDTIVVIEADLNPSSWLYPLFSGLNLRRLMINDGTSLVSSVSDPNCPLDAQNSLELLQLSEMEAIMRTKIPAHITSIYPLSITGLFAVATIDSNGQGAVHVYSCVGFQDKDRPLKRRGSVVDTKRLPSSFHFVAASSGFYSSVSSLCEVLEGVLLISCSTDVYLLKLDVSDTSLQIVRSEPRRSPAYCMSAFRSSDKSAKVAIYDEDGIEVIEIDMTSEKVFTHLLGDTVCRTGGKVAWVNERYLLVTDKMGIFSIVDTQNPSSAWLKTIRRYVINDIPYSICRSPEKPNSLLIGSMLGAIYEFDLDVCLETKR